MFRFDLTFVVNWASHIKNQKLFLTRSKVKRGDMVASPCVQRERIEMTNFSAPTVLKISNRYSKFRTLPFQNQVFKMQIAAFAYVFAQQAINLHFDIHLADLVSR